MVIKAPISTDIGLSLPQLERSNAVGAPAPASFEKALSSAVGELSRSQQAADDASVKLAHGAGNLHEVAMAMEQADITMRLAVKVRNKVVEAYQDVMRMGV